MSFKPPGLNQKPIISKPSKPTLAEQIANAKRKVLLKEMQKKAKDINKKCIV